MKKFSKAINIILVIIMLVGGIWAAHNYLFLKKEVKIDVIEEPKTEPFNYEPFIPVASAILLFFLKYYFYDKKKLKIEITRKFNNEKHPIFMEINELLTVEIDHLDFGSEGRTEMFRLMLSTQLRSYERCLRAFLGTNKTFVDSADFRAKSRALIFDIMNAYQQRWRELDIPEPVITTYRKWHGDRIELLLSDIDTIAFYKVSQSYDESVFYFFNSILFLLKLGIAHDSIKSLQSLNGHINKLTFKGKLLS